MVFRLEEAITAVCAPSPGPDAGLHVCQAVFESSRYLVYAVEALLVVLVEAPSSCSRDDASSFDLWQVWDAQETINCVRFNRSKIVARGALALCVDEGRGVLLMPSSATSSRAAAVAAASSVSTREDGGKPSPSVAAGGDAAPRADYVKAHLHLHLPRWAESVRWKCDDRLLNHLEWVESGDDLFLLGAGEKLSIWKMVDDSVQLYLQRTVTLFGDGGPTATVAPVRHFDVAPSGRFAATAGQHDRIVKVWGLGELSPHESAPMALFLAHTRALVAIIWAKEANLFSARASVASTMAACEMLFTLDRAGNVSIWRENVSPLRSFALWKTFVALDFCRSSAFEYDEPRANLERQIRVFGIVDHYWAHKPLQATSSLREALLSEKTVMDALCLFHYGYGSLDEARRNELVTQRMDSTVQMNAKLLGDRTGAIADTHVGETVICGNVALEKAFAVHLVYGVLNNGDLCVFRAESILFSGVSPRLSLLFSFDGLREHFADAHVYSASSSGYQDQEMSKESFYIELLFQRKTDESYLWCARLKIQVDNTSSGYHNGQQGSTSYSVEGYHVSALCSSMMSAKKLEDVGSTSLSVANMVTSRVSSDDTPRFPMKIVATNMGGRLNVSKSSWSLRKLDVAFRSKLDKGIGSVTHTAAYEARGVLYLLTGGRLQVATLRHCGEQQDTKYGGENFSKPSEPRIKRLASVTDVNHNALELLTCYMDESDDSVELHELVGVSIPESVKIEWSSNSSSFFSQPATQTPRKDYNMVVGLHKDGSQLSVWVFTFETMTSDSSESSVQLFRKTIVSLAGPRVLSLTNVPLMDAFDVTFATFNADLQLTLWTFVDLDEMLEVKPAHRVDVAALMRLATQAQRSHMEFHVTEEQFEFKIFSISSCGRVAILLEGDEDEAISSEASTCGDQICFLPIRETSLEGIVAVPRKQFGLVVSLQWTPLVTPERDCELLFLSTTTIGMLKFDCSLPTNKWSIAWSSSRFSVRPESISSLSSYPYGLLVIGPSLANVNLRDIDGIGSSPLPQSNTSSANPYRRHALSSQRPSKAFPAHHPITLMYLLARGSFQILEKILDHVKTQIVKHEETCYLRMSDDTLLQNMPLLSLTELLGDPTSTDSKGDKRSDVYLKGKFNKGSGASTTSAAPARASDLFAMDFGTPRRYGAKLTPGEGTDRADMLFAPRNDQADGGDTLNSEGSSQMKSNLETDFFPKFFNDHKNSLSFMATEEAEVFLAVVAGIKKTLAWERDNSRQKDEASLRFHASLLWPVEPMARDRAVEGAVDQLGAAPDLHPASDTNKLVPTHRDVDGLCSEQVAWGAVSDFQSELLQECFPESTMTWKEMKRLRLPFWLKSSTKLSHFAEKVAQAEYAVNRDPFSVAVFYVLLGKTKLLASLFKMANESRIAELVSNDFSDLRWKNAALKNAYVLKTKQRYELSAAFFLLGGKVIEAVSVAESADETLVLSFLIARLSEKWDLGGQDGSASGTGASDFSQASFTGLSSSLRGFGVDSTRSSGMLDVGLSSAVPNVKTVCVDFLRTTVWTRACERGDVYMRFLVKYFLGETSNAIDALVTTPVVEIRSFFGIYENPDTLSGSLYWSSFGKSLLGACDLLRFLRKTIVPMKLATKEKIMKLNTSALLRMQDAGLSIPALIQQRDIAPFVQEFRRERANSPDAAAFLGCRQRVLIAAVGNQVDFLYATFLKSMRESMKLPASSIASTRFELEERLNEEIQCVVNRGGNFAMPEIPESNKEHLAHTVRASVVESLVHSGRLAALDFLVSGWNHAEDSAVTERPFISPLPRFVEVIAEGVVMVASGDLMSAATDYSHTRKVDQTCSELLAMAARLLLWLQYFYLKSPKERAALPNREFVRVAVAAVYSVICICCRYLKNPCCLHRVLCLIFPHKSDLPTNLKEALNEISGGDVCVTCTPLRSSTPTPPTVVGVSTLGQDIPVLHQAVCMLELELDEFTAAVKTSRLHRPRPSSDIPTPLYSYCSYWGMVLVMAAGAMPAHVANVSGDSVVSTVDLSKKLVEAWTNYSNKLAEFAMKHLLCDLAGFFFSPFSVSQSASGQEASPIGSPRASSPTRTSMSGSPRGILSGSPGAPPSPQNIGRGNRRQLLRCECERCPWILLVELFTDKNELLLRLNAQLECCSEKMNEEIRWGRLPEPVSRQSALTRSQKLLLSSVVENAASLSRATNLTNQLKRRMASMPATAAVNVHCVYRSETNIKAMCFNRAAGGDTEVSLCTSKGIFRASCMDYADGSRFQFKGMYGAPKTSAFFPSNPSQPSPVKSRLPTPENNFHQELLSPSSGLTIRIGPSSPLRNPSHLLASPSEPKVASFKPTALASHPFMPLFVSGNHKGRVHLWSYDRLSVICAFQTKDIVAPYPSSPSMLSSSRGIKALEFDSLGQHLGAVDALGHLFLWKFAELDRVPYYRELVCHDKGARGLAFLNSSSSVATVGLSSERRNMCVWDTLLPSSKALVAAPACHSAGATAVVFSSTHQLLISGGAGGALSVFDMRQRRVLHTISNAHETPIKTLVLHPSGDCVLSGSASGDVKIWSLPIFREAAFLSKVHVKPSFLGDAATNLLGDAASNVAINVTNSSWGVTDAVATNDAFFTSGTDGSVQRLRLPSLGARL